MKTPKEREIDILKNLVISPDGRVVTISLSLPLRGDREKKITITTSDVARALKDAGYFIKYVSKSCVCSNVSERKRFGVWIFNLIPAKEYVKTLSKKSEEAKAEELVVDITYSEEQIQRIKTESKDKTLKMPKLITRKDIARQNIEKKVKTVNSGSSKD